MAEFLSNRNGMKLDRGARDDRKPARGRKGAAPAPRPPVARPLKNWKPPSASGAHSQTTELAERTASLQHLAKAEEERDHLLRKLAERDEQIRVLADRVELMSGREADLHAMLLEAHEKLFNGDGSVHSDPTPARANGVAYPALVGEVRRIARDVVLPQATVIVVSKGDDELLKLDGRRAWHFPQAETGVYAGHYPADSAAAIEHLESLRARGGQYLVFPATAFWWFEHYRDFKQYLDGRYEAVGDPSCVIYKLFKPR